MYQADEKCVFFLRSFSQFNLSGLLSIAIVVVLFLLCYFNSLLLLYSGPEINYYYY